jgi:ribosome-binding ATPase YchF (GTP1/OBG family)
MAYATKECAEKSLGVRCKPRNSLCADGIRKLPVNVIDVAGLVEGAHEGKGMGNQFLNDLAASDALMLVVDASGTTDQNGNHSDNCNPVDDVKMVKKELTEWLFLIMKRHMSTISRSNDSLAALEQVLAGLKVSGASIARAAERSCLPTSRINWGDADIRSFARELLKTTKPMLIIANKSDAKGAEANIAALVGEFGKENVIECSAAIELALRKADSMGVISYNPWERDFKIIKEVTKEQENALEYMRKFLKERGTNVQEAVNRAVFGTLENIVVYPVEDESKYSDHFGNVLPDAILIRKGATALDLAGRIHTDIAKGMLYAIDARSKRRLGKEYILNDGDVIKIVSTAK